MVKPKRRSSGSTVFDMIAVATSVVTVFMRSPASTSTLSSSPEATLYQASWNAAAPVEEAVSLRIAGTPVRPSRSATFAAMLARFSNSSLSMMPICTASKARTRESSRAFSKAWAKRSKTLPKTRPVRSTLVSPTPAIWTGLAMKP